VKFIAEVCSNHNGSIERAKTLIATAAKVGCTAVKFQLFRLDKLFAPEVLASQEYKFLEKRRTWELPLEWLPQLREWCIERKMEFGCTPFYPEAVDQLLPYVDFFKVASYNLLDLTLIRRVAATGKPVILSTGMGSSEEIRDALVALNGSKYELLHCISEYPTKSYNLSRFKALRQMCGAVGWSDHTVDPAAMYYFYSQDARTFEFHLDLDGEGWEYGIGHCWLPEQIRPVISTIQKMEQIKSDYGEVEAEGIERWWRADPVDGLRPLMEIRKRL
jgi:N-acetylneuraminate synthase